GVLVCLAISVIDYEVILKLWPFIGGISVLLMLLLFKFGTGPSGRSDVKTWLDLGVLYFQPSELLKAAFIVTFSVHLELVGSDINNLVNILLLCVHGAVPTLLVVLTGDMGSALVFLMIFTVMMFLAGVKLRYFAVALGTVIAAAPIVWIKVFNNIQRERFLALLYPESYEDIIYQQARGKTAIGTGQFFGKGLFKGSLTQSGYVPEAKNDMILSVVGEELGFVGCLALMILFVLLILRIVKVARLTPDNPGKYLCYGVAAMIASQVIVNVGMVLMYLPVIGITLPFMSAGGSANLCIYIAMGLVFSVYRINKDRAPVDFRIINVRTPYH
ncbi:MAG TPA: hypothetical protein DDY98_01365, partial [Ruminococcaceae bacterium]|nr:hypothetical protein [Oscillospiraceae bacterium]